MTIDERQNAIDRLRKAKEDDAQMLDLSITDENVNLHVKNLRSFNHNKSADFMIAMFNRYIR